MLFSSTSTTSRVLFGDKLCTELLKVEGQIWKIVSVEGFREKLAESNWKNFVTAIITQQHKPLKIYKTGKQRTISLIQEDSVQGVLKSYHPQQNFWHTVKKSLRGTSAANEFIRCLQVKHTGVLTPGPFCYLEPLNTANKYEGFIILEEISDSCDLKSLTQNTPVSTCRIIAQKLGDMIANMQNQGLHHRDLHAENFLWQEKTQTLFLLDLQGITHQPRLTTAQVKQQLGQLFYSLGREVSHAVRWEFWCAYHTKLTDGNLVSSLECKQRFRDSLKSASLFAQQCLSRGDRKWERGNRRLRIIKSPQSHTRALSSISDLVQLQIDQHPQILFAGDANITPIKMSANRQVAIVQSRLFLQPIFVKQEQQPKLKAVLPGWGKYAPARHAWEIGHAFNRRKIPTPVPLLMRESSKDGKYSGTIITEALPQAIALSAYLDTYLPQMKNARAQVWLKAYHSRIGVGMARMHLGKFDHRDLKSNNILVEHNPGLTGYWIIDLDAVRWWPFSLPRQRRAQNIARLAADLVQSGVVSLTILLRGLKSYLKEFSPVGSSCEWKPFWREVSKQVSSILDRKIKRQSPTQKFHKAA